MAPEKKATCTCGCIKEDSPEQPKSAPDQDKGMLKQGIFHTIGSVLFSCLYAFFPKCPICWAAWMGVFSSLGLAQIPYQPWLLPVMGVLLIVHIGLLYRAIPQKGYGPLGLSLLGAVVLLAARFWVADDGWVYTGMAFVISGALWNSLPESVLKTIAFASSKLYTGFQKIFTAKTFSTMRLSKFTSLWLWLLLFAPVSMLYAQVFTVPMPVPPLDTGMLVGDHSRIYIVEPEDGIHQFTPDGTMYKTMGFNQLGYLGPTIQWNYGDSVMMSVHNHLHHSTTVHWHGAHVPARADGGPHDTIAPNAYWQPKFKVLDPPATMWYHPHLHHHTLEQVNKGLAAMIIIRDPNDPFEPLLPHTYGVDDFPIIVQDKDLTQDTINTTCTMGITFLVNGMENPVLDVPAQQVRFRILNGGSERVFALYFDDNTPFKIIATDAGYTAKPLGENFVILGTGERTEWVMDFTGREGQELYLSNIPSLLGPSVPGNPTSAVPSCYNNGNQNFVDSFPVRMLKLRIGPSTANPILTLPAAFAPLQIPSLNDVSVERTKKLVFYNTDGNAPPFSIDSTDFDLATINDIVQLNATEIWKIVNTSGVAHPFHIHDISFHILDMKMIGSNDTLPIPTYFKGPKDVVLVPDQTVIRYITKFTDFATPIDPEFCYMYHCHILSHEDGGMMHQFVVTDLSDTEAPLATPEDWSIYPNPGHNNLNIKGICPDESRVELYNLVGQKVAQYQLPPIDAGQSVGLTKTLPPGTYIVHWVRTSGTTSKVWIAE